MDRVTLNVVSDEINQFLEDWREKNRFPIHQIPPLWYFKLEEAANELNQVQLCLNDLMDRVYKNERLSDAALRRLERFYMLEDGTLVDTPDPRVEHSVNITQGEEPCQESLSAKSAPKDTNPTSYFRSLLNRLGKASISFSERETKPNTSAPSPEPETSNCTADAIGR